MHSNIEQLVGSLKDQGVLELSDAPSIRDLYTQLENSELAYCSPSDTFTRGRFASLEARRQQKIMKRQYFKSGASIGEASVLQFLQAPWVERNIEVPNDEGLNV